ncbi:MAG: GAF domain-containing protein [Minicystis sp.]
MALCEEIGRRAAIAVDNAKLYAMAQRAAQAREEFLVIASHELRTPLAPLKLAVQSLLARARAEGEPDPRSARLLARVSRCTDRLGVLVEELLDIARLSAERLDLTPASVDLAAVVKDVLAQSGGMLAEAGCAVRVDAAGPTSGRWDRPWLEKALGRLLSNAAKYGHGRPVEIRVEGGADTVRLAVCDHGFGIPAAEQARIFERFERAVSTRHYGGFGFGLWSVRRIAEAHGGFRAGREPARRGRDVHDRAAATRRSLRGARQRARGRGVPQMSPSGPRPLAAVDLTTCDREPIHVPGAIQPHGVLFTLREPDLVIVQVSANAAAFTDVAPADLLGRPLATLVDARSSRIIGAVLAGDEPQEHNPLPVTIAGRTFDGIVHRHRGATLLELEPRPAEDDGAPAFSLKAAFGNMAAVTNLHDLLVAAARDVRRITGYDRVLIYRFDADAHGEVIAEDRRADLESFLGLHYPASDIPKQARALYLANCLRIIPDREYEPVPIVPRERPDTGELLDLTFSVLRSVSPVHLEYMRNIGFRASMSISLVRSGALWGLISCSHGAPRYVPYALRATCEIIARYLSSQIAAKERLEALQAIDRRRGTLTQLVKHVRAEGDLARGLVRRSPHLLDLVEAGGAAVYTAGGCLTLGQTPRAEQIGLLVGWLCGAVRDEVFATDALSGLCTFADAFRDIGSGVLAFSLPKPDPEYVLWFRPEVVQTVRWGGDPQKPVEPGPDGSTLQPRRSFALWQELVRGKSLPWSPADVEIAGTLRHLATELDLARQVEREQAARVAAEAAQLRFLFLREAGLLLGGSLDYETTLGSVARLATDRFADLCVIDLITESGVLRRVQVQHASPLKQPIAEALYRHTPYRDGDCDASLVAGGRATLRTRLDRDWLRERVARDDALFDLLWTQLHVRSLIAAPLVARGRALGEILLLGGGVRPHLRRGGPRGRRRAGAPRRARHRERGPVPAHAGGPRRGAQGVARAGRSHRHRLPRSRQSSQRRDRERGRPGAGGERGRRSGSTPRESGRAHSPLGQAHGHAPPRSARYRANSRSPLRGEPQAGGALSPRGRRGGGDSPARRAQADRAPSGGDRVGSEGERRSRSAAAGALQPPR